MIKIYKKILHCKKYLKKVLLLHLIMILLIFNNNNICYTKNKDNKEVLEPTFDEQKDNKSEAIVYAGGNNIFSPINEERPGFVQEEYDKVNNYNIDFDTLTLRIKYFSPNYDSSKIDLINNSIINSGMRGVDTTNITSNTLDNTNSTLISGMESLVKIVKTEILNYLSAEEKFKRLSIQNELSKRLLNLAEYNLANGLSIATEYNNANLEETSSFQQMEAARNDMVKYKTSIAKYLGYSLLDIDKLVFIEPKINIEDIIKIEYEKDFNKMLISDSNYIRTLVAGDEGSNGSKKLPGSTGQDIYNRKVQMAKQNVEVNFERLYANLINKCRLYVSNLSYLSKIANLKEADNNSKYQNNLINETDYINNSIDVLKDRGLLADSKYELLKAYNDYYYSTLLY